MQSPQKSPQQPFTSIKFQEPSRYNSNGESNSPSSVKKLLNVDTRPSHRKGHHHRHSLSHQYFLPPKNRKPLSFPATYPIPTIAESFSILTWRQRLKLSSSILFFLAAVFVFLSGDATVLLSLSCSLIVEGVLIILNVWRETLDCFVVWRRTSLRYPFGLQQVELLADFAFSILLLFLGLNLLKEPAEHAIEDWGNIEHLEHSGAEVAYIRSTFSILIALLLSGTALLFDHSHMHSQRLDSRFFHGLTLVPSLILFVLKSLGVQVGSLLSHIFAISIAVTAVIAGFSIAKSLSMLLLLTYSNKDKVFQCISLIKEDSRIEQLNSATIWQPHYNMCIANICITVRGSEREQLSIREDVMKIIQKTVGSIFGAGVQPKWEITIDIQRI
ncbi:cation diffusion family zinc membrane transporter Zrg17 [Schizosaccharomyces cryophilus OY26]|uniref:Cation diffusion family zinc membrane transporter Zrg17 n=1 Tax=Schizosaccharomyces cryophilus (strain OY26 / ATCC MYA-4695 / CBS 11777 / NBRC 106824 / NRRL Y48691) TaxID=653667 RepID=S9XAC0_SCHCR|nr:cation diffusion family zinc membrane transporter Zrg17 [Schizosaccharomyces cryophilus OY26]EPY54107.1 cation diffusion family zinc membrane transporter Zrg17 [Schizosaccharomyces cryophilus OY26]